MTSAFILLVPIAFAAIHFLEFSAILARVAGIREASHMVGYSIQQAVYVATRLFIVSLLPMLGFLVDKHIPQAVYIQMALGALTLAAVFSVVALLLREHIIRYYTSAIKRYKSGRSFTAALFGRTTGGHADAHHLRNVLREVVTTSDSRRLAIASSVVFAVYSTGIFISFYLALMHFEYRASISQLSGILNSIGTVLLTFYVEPAISRGIDEERGDADILVFGLLAGRLVGVALLAPFIVLLVYGLTNA